jgi:hypothetical protein
MVKLISTKPCPIGIRLNSNGWEILCPPGSLGQLLSQLAQAPEPPSTVIDGLTMLQIPMTAALDEALESLVNTLIKLRYDTGRVQLELFSEETI